MVRALFDRDIARWVQEAPNFFQVAAEERSDGLLITMRVREENDVLRWLLGWGSHVCVLEPDSLKEALRIEAEAVARTYGS
jgi:predicted DNA-binding transcriptional regulator YafY